MDAPKYPITKEKLVREYYRVEKLLRRKPMTPDFKGRGKVSRYSDTAYKNHFGSWNKFLKYIGEDIVIDRSITKEKLIRDYYDAKRRLGKKPVSKDFNGKNKVSKYGLSAYIHHFGSWNKFLESIGEGITRDRAITKEKLIEDYYRVKKLLGRRPLLKDFRGRGRISNYSGATYMNHFGTWSWFLYSIGERG